MQAGSHIILHCRKFSLKLFKIVVHFVIYRVNAVYFYTVMLTYPVKFQTFGAVITVHRLKKQ